MKLNIDNTNKTSKINMLGIRIHVTGAKPVSSKPNKEFCAMISRPELHRKT